MSTPLRVGFFSNHASIIGGGEISFIDLVDNVRTQGIEPEVFVPEEGEVGDRLRGRGLQPRLYRLPSIRFFSLLQLFGSLIGLVGMLKKSNVDIVHVNGARSMLMVGMAARICDIPAVWHVRVMERDRTLDRIRSMLASEIVVNSGAVALTLKPVCSKNRRINIVHNGIDIGRFSAATPFDLTRAFPLPQGNPVVLGVGRLCRMKRFHVLLEACALLRESGVPPSCLIIGRDAEAEPEYVNELRTMPARLGLNNLVFGGDRDDVAAIMKSSAIFVLPSDSEAFGRVVVEAWACSLPVVATNNGGPAEIIEHGKTGLLVPVDDPKSLADAIVAILSDTKLRDNLAANGRARAEDFTITAHVRNITHIYSRMALRH